jgi:hypothetical protein
MIAMPKSELPTSKRKFGSTTLTPDEAREVGREKRAEIAKAQAEAKAEAEANRESGVDKIATTIPSAGEILPPISVKIAWRHLKLRWKRQQAIYYLFLL